MQFNEHGNYQVQLDGTILYYKVTNVWNEEASVNCIKKIENAFNICAGKPVAMIVDTSKFEGGIPEAFSLWHKAANFWYAHNLTAFIRIDHPDNLNYQLFLTKIDAVLKEKVNFTFASDFQDAVNIAHQLGFSGFEDKTKFPIISF